MFNRNPKLPHTVFVASPPWWPPSWALMVGLGGGTAVSAGPEPRTSPMLERLGGAGHLPSHLIGRPPMSARKRLRLGTACRATMALLRLGPLFPPESGGPAHLDANSASFIRRATRTQAEAN